MFLQSFQSVWFFVHWPTISVATLDIVPKGSCWYCDIVSLEISSLSRKLNERIRVCICVNVYIQLCTYIYIYDIYTYITNFQDKVQTCDSVLSDTHVSLKK